MNIWKIMLNCTAQKMCIILCDIHWWPWRTLYYLLNIKVGGLWLYGFLSECKFNKYTSLLMSVADENMKRFLLNNQHQCLSVCQLANPIPFFIVFGYSKNIIARIILPSFKFIFFMLLYWKSNFWKGEIEKPINLKEKNTKDHLWNIMNSPTNPIQSILSSWVTVYHHHD